MAIINILQIEIVSEQKSGGIKEGKNQSEEAIYLV